MEVIFMSGFFDISVMTDFAASHIIHGHPGKCARLHGHNWKVEACVRIPSDSLNEIGIGIDFKDLKIMIREIIDKLEHRHLNDIQPFDKINPTAENVSKWIFQEISGLLSNNKNNNIYPKVQFLALWENDRSCVRYSEK